VKGATRTCPKCARSITSKKTRGRPQVYCSSRCQSAASSERNRKRDNPHLLSVEERNERFAMKTWREKIIPELALAGTGPIDSAGHRFNPSIMRGGNREGGGGLDLTPRRRGTINGWNESKKPDDSPDSTRSIYATCKAAESPLEADPTFIEHIRLHTRAVSGVSGDVVRDVLEDWVLEGFVPLAEVERQRAILPRDWVQGTLRRLQLNNRHAQEMNASVDSTQGT